MCVFVSNLQDSTEGPPATFTHQASRSRFGINANYVQCERINDVFTAVEKVDSHDEGRLDEAPRLL